MISFLLAGAKYAMRGYLSTSWLAGWILKYVKNIPYTDHLSRQIWLRNILEVICCLIRQCATATPP
jgi:hypothetical protein